MLVPKVTKLIVIGLLICLRVGFSAGAVEPKNGKTSSAEERRETTAKGGGRGTKISSEKPVAEAKNRTASSNPDVNTDGNNTMGRVGGGGGGAASEATGSMAADEPSLFRPSGESLQIVEQVDSPNSLRIAILDLEDGNRPIAEVLSDLVEENNPFRARELILAILLRKQEALPVLSEALQSGSHATKWTVLSLLCKNLGWREMSDQVLNVVRDPNTPDRVLTRAIAAAAVLDMKEGADVIRRVFAESKNDNVREVAIRALGELKHSDARNDLKNALTDPSIRIVLAAADSLGKMGDPNGYSIAAKNLDHSDWFVRKLAAAALGHIGTDEALNRLSDHLINETSPMARAEAEIAISQMSMDRMARSERLLRMQQLLDSKNLFVSRWAHKEMLKRFPEECISIFRERSLKSSGKSKETAEIYLLLGEERKKGGYTHE